MEVQLEQIVLTNLCLSFMNKNRRIRLFEAYEQDPIWMILTPHHHETRQYCWH
jgi:hypothetical protein